MNANHREPNRAELDEARLTAYALGQLHDTERAAVEAQFAELDAEEAERLRQTVEEIRALADHVSEASRQDALPQRSPALRAAIECRLSQSEDPAMSTPEAPSCAKSRPWYRRRWLAVAVAACLLIAAIPIGLMIAGRVTRDRATEVALIAQRRSELEGVHGSAQAISATSERELEVEALFADSEVKVVSGSRDPSSVGSLNRLSLEPGATVDPYAAGMRGSGVAGPGQGLGTGSALAQEGPSATVPRYEEGGYGGMAGMMGMGSGAPTPSANVAPSHDGESLSSMGSMYGSVPPASGQMMGESEGAPPEVARSAARHADMAGVAFGPAPNGGQSGATVVLGHPLAPARITSQERVLKVPRDLMRGDVAGVPRDGWNMQGVYEEEQPDFSFSIGFTREAPHPDQTYGIEETTAPTVPGTEQYEVIVENKFLPVAARPLSTFSIDVDTASYTNVRRFLNQGQLPPPSAVRIEEMVNYFRYDYGPPEDEAPFSVDVEVAQCPWRGEHRLLRVGLKGREIERDQRGPSNLVFLLDVSGSMRDDAKLPLVKRAMRLLVDQLNEDDRVAIVTYASNAGLKLESTCASDKPKIQAAIDALSAGGSTHGSAGIQLAYEQAAEHFVEGGTNRVILATDGDLNVGITDDDALVKLIRKKAKSGVFLTVLGFGTGNLKDAKMEKLADHGNGVYAYLDSLREAQKVLVEQISASLVTIAKDVKIQIEFNPAEVAAYRLLGYENRVMAARDFDDDKKDAGEIGAGHTVTALYELVPAGEEPTEEGAGSMLKYQRVPPQPPTAELTDEASSGELLTLRLRYKEPDGKKSKLLEFVAQDSGKRFGEASPDFQFAAAAASFGLVLRRSRYMGDLTLAAVEEFAVSGLGDDSGGYRAEFVDLVRKARELSER